MTRSLVLLAVAAVAVDAHAQTSQEKGLHITTVSSSAPGRIQVLITPDAATDAKIGTTPNAKDFMMSLRGGAAPDVTVARNGSRGKPLTTVFMIDYSLSYKNKFGTPQALPAIDNYTKDSGSDELAFVAFSLNITTSQKIHTNKADFDADLKTVAAKKGKATSVTIALDKAFDILEAEGEPGLREVIVFTDALDEAKNVTAETWKKLHTRALELGVRVHVILPTEEATVVGGNPNWVDTTTGLMTLATDTHGEKMTTLDVNEMTAKLQAARTALKKSLVVDGKLCGVASGDPVNVRVEYVPGAKHEAFTAEVVLAAPAWAPTSKLNCPSLCSPLCPAWEECIVGTCAPQACTNDSSCLGGSVCLGGVCGKACSPTCASWQECRGGSCGARSCAGDENCGAGSRCVNSVCTTPKAKSSNSLIFILAGAGALLLATALFVLFRKKPEAPVVATPTPTQDPVVEEPKKNPPEGGGGVDLDPLPETHLVAIGGWTTKGERWRLHKRKTITGASADASDGVDIVFGGIKQVSSRHAQFDLYPSGDLWVTDLGSTNGTFVNGKKLTAKERHKLVPGDQVKLSQNLILVVERPGVSGGEGEEAPKQADAKQADAGPKPKDRTRFDPGGR